MEPGFSSSQQFPLNQYSLIESTCPDALQSAVSKEIDKHDFSYLDNLPDHGSRITCVRLSKMVLFGVRFGANIHASTPPARALQLVVPVRGRIIKHEDGIQHTARAGDALILRPAQPVDLDWLDESVAIVAWIDRSVLNDVACCSLGRPLSPEVEFPSLISRRAGSGRSTSNCLSMLMSEIEESESLFSRGITTRSIEELFITTLLHAAPNLHDAGETRELAARSSVQCATDYIRENIQNEISLSDLVGATGVSFRKLQYDFSRELGVGPMTMVRREKLARARQILETAGPDEVTVVDVAAGLGFYDRRYFTRLYKKEFGEPPSLTLSRVRY